MVKVVLSIRRPRLLCSQLRSTNARFCDKVVRTDQRLKKSRNGLGRHGMGLFVWMSVVRIDHERAWRILCASRVIHPIPPPGSARESERAGDNDSTSDNRHAVASPEPLSGPACLLARFNQSLDEILPGNLIEENLPRRPPRHMIRLRKKCLRYGGTRVVDRAWVLKTQLAGHDDSLTKGEIIVTTENERVYG